ncbi:MAG: FTR1 family iron permease, partial [Burkholderiales bacterium]
DAQRALSGTALSGGAAFTSSLIILLREGLEAILVLAAMVAFLIRAGRRDALLYVHSGWIAALVAGIATWVLSEYAFAISGATREVTEGAATLAAAAILFYVGFWMHRNASMTRWSRYLHGKLQSALSRQALWTLCVIAFLAVYREVFETILFYQALWLQVTAQAHFAVFAGGAIAVVLLVVSVWLIARSGMRLPMRQFFLASAALMVILAIVFAGRGVGSLQEAGRIPVRPLNIPGIEYLGIHPTVQAAGLQLLLLVLALGLVIHERRAKKPA